MKQGGGMPAARIHIGWVFVVARFGVSPVILSTFGLAGGDFEATQHNVDDAHVILGSRTSSWLPCLARYISIKAK